MRQKNVDFVPHLFEYVERGGTSHSAEVLGVVEHKIIKTLVFETSQGNPLIVLQHGDKEVSEKKLARYLNVKSVSPASSAIAHNLTGYVFGGTSPFGLKIDMPVFAEKTIFILERIYINAGKRGFLVEIEPKVLREILHFGDVEMGI